MSDRLSDKCRYCGSPAVLDDAWFCGRLECYEAYENEAFTEAAEAQHFAESDEEE